MSAVESMSNLDLTIKITTAELVGISGEYIVLRVIQKNPSPPLKVTEEFKGIEIYALQILREAKEGKWKFRSSQVLSAKQQD